MLEACWGGGGCLVTLGGSDTSNLVFTVLKEITKSEVRMPFNFICSSGFDNYEMIKNYCKGNKYLNIHLPGNIVDIMAGADVALCAGGVTSLELAYLGIPMSILIRSENQKTGARGLMRIGAARVAVTVQKCVENLHDIISNASDRTVMSNAGREAVDGLGVERIYLEFLRLVGKN